MPHSDPEKAISSDVDSAAMSGEQVNLLLDYIADLLRNMEPPSDEGLSAAILENPRFLTLVQNIMDIRQLSNSLWRGDLQKFVFSKGYILSNLKALQSDLRHLSWQTKMIAQGDFSQRVDFLGDFSIAFNEMTDHLRRSSAQLQRLATHDMLTDVANRLSLDQFMQEAFDHTVKAEEPFSLLLIDLDHFKNVNDQHGHAAGDQVLVDISQLLSRQLRSGDLFARYGGEEFVAALPNTPLDVAQNIAQRLVAVMRDHVTVLENGQEIRVTGSIGVSDFREGDLSYETILARSDAALYDAKNAGRDRVCTL